MDKKPLVTKKPQIDLGITIRKEVLTTSLVVEGFTAMFLSSLLGIRDYKKSKVLGNSSSSISFNQKINMLIEIGALSKNDRKKFETFMEMRNQFMHNLDATTYEKCFAVMPDNKDNFVLKTYPQDASLSREEQLELAAKKLGEEIVTLTMGITESIKVTIGKEVQADTTDKSNQAFIQSIEQVKTGLDKFFDREIEKGETFNSKRLKGFGTEVAKLVYVGWKQNFAKLLAPPIPATDKTTEAK